MARSKSRKVEKTRARQLSQARQDKAFMQQKVPDSMLAEQPSVPDVAVPAEGDSVPGSGSLASYFPEGDESMEDQCPLPGYCEAAWELFVQDQLAHSEPKWPDWETVSSDDDDDDNGYALTTRTENASSSLKTRAHDPCGASPTNKVPEQIAANTGFWPGFGARVAHRLRWAFWRIAYLTLALAVVLANNAITGIHAEPHELACSIYVVLMRIGLQYCLFLIIFEDGLPYYLDFCAIREAQSLEA